MRMLPHRMIHGRGPPCGRKIRGLHRESPEKATQEIPLPNFNLSQIACFYTPVKTIDTGVRFETTKFLSEIRESMS